MLLSYNNSPKDFERFHYRASYPWVKVSVEKVVSKLDFHFLFKLMQVEKKSWCRFNWVVDFGCFFQLDCKFLVLDVIVFDLVYGCDWSRNVEPENEGAKKNFKLAENRLKIRREGTFLEKAEKQASMAPTSPDDFGLLPFYFFFLDSITFLPFDSRKSKREIGPIK